MTEDAVHELLTEEMRHYGDFSYTIKITEDKPKKVRICQNCQEPDEHDDHWDDLDGPNRAGYGCSRKRPTLADEIKAIKAKLR